MRTVFGYSRYLVLIGIIGLLLAAVAVFIFGGIATVSTVIDNFSAAEFDAEGARLFSVDLIELVDLFLLGTVLLITSIGLYQLFLDPHIQLPLWLSVESLEELKFNLVAVIVVMLVILFLGAAAIWEGGNDIIYFGAAVALVILAAAGAVMMLGHVSANSEDRAERERRAKLSGEISESELTANDWPS